MNSRRSYILAVDDDITNRKLLSTIFEEEGYSSILLEKGAQVCDLLQKEPEKFGILLLDWMMPEMDGLEVLYKIRSFQNPSKNIPVVMLTAIDKKKFVDQAFAGGANDYVLKPFKAPFLLKKIDKWFSFARESQVFISDTFHALQKILSFTEKEEDLFQENILKKVSSSIASAMSFGESVKILLRLVQDHNSETFIHAFRAATYFSLFSDKCKLPREDKEAGIIGALLHDAGKLKVPNSILDKSAPLSIEEWEIVKDHVGESIRFAKKIPHIPEKALEFISGHHERMDGSGYPRALKGSQLSTLIRMSAIVDTFTALTGPYPYRPPYSFDKAFEIMVRSPGHFDTELLSNFSDLVFSLHGAPK